MSTIETLNDWNERLNGCGCCPMPLCPAPECVAESISADFSGESMEYENGIHYLSGVRKYWWYDDNGNGAFHDGENFTATRRGWNMNCGPCGESDIEAWPESSRPPATAYITAVETVSQSDPWNAAAYVTACLTKLNTFDFENLTCAAEHSTAASLTGPTTDDGPTDNSFTKIRYRWKVPDTHTGSHFKVTWDEVFFPHTGDPVAVETDKVWEWTGPGNKEVPDDESWLSGWHDLQPPETEGEKRIVNIRFEGYRSPYGNKPQVTGEAVDLDA